MIVRSATPLGHSPRGGVTLSKGDTHLRGARLLEGGGVEWTKESPLTRGEKAFVEAMIKAKVVQAFPDPPDSETRLKAADDDRDRAVPVATAGEKPPELRRRRRR